MGGSALAEMVVGDAVHRQFDEYILHPAVLDACAQTFSVAWGVMDFLKPDHSISYLPAKFGRIRRHDQSVRGKAANPGGVPRAPGAR